MILRVDDDNSPSAIMRRCRYLIEKHAPRLMQQAPPGVKREYTKTPPEVWAKIDAAIAAGKTRKEACEAQGVPVKRYNRRLFLARRRAKK